MIKTDKRGGSLAVNVEPCGPLRQDFILNDSQMGEMLTIRNRSIGKKTTTLITANFETTNDFKSLKKNVRVCVCGRWVEREWTSSYVPELVGINW